MFTVTSPNTQAAGGDIAIDDVAFASSCCNGEKHGRLALPYHTSISLPHQHVVEQVIMIVLYLVTLSLSPPPPPRTTADTCT